LTGDPGLGALVGDDGLPGEAHYPVLADSPVIDAANRHACPKTDQLGNKRDGICDIGSIEFQKKGFDDPPIVRPKWSFHIVVTRISDHHAEIGSVRIRRLP